MEMLRQKAACGTDAPKQSQGLALSPFLTRYFYTWLLNTLSNPCAINHYVILQIRHLTNKYDNQKSEAGHLQALLRQCALQMYSRDALLSPPFLQLHPFSLGSEMSTQHYKFDRILFISSLSFVHISFRLAESSLRKSTWKKREKHISDFNSKMQKVFCSIK